MRRKILFLIAIALLVLISTLIIFIVRVDNSSSSTNITKSMTNSKKVIDYGENVIRYGNYVYILDELSNSIIRYDKNLR